MRTCWVIDHPAHFQLFRRWIADGDTLVVTERQELDVMLLDGFSQPILRVPRVTGRLFGKVDLGRKRTAAVGRFLKNHQVDRIISKGAPFELRAARGLVEERWYLTDTEVNTIAHRLAKSAATHILLPESWSAPDGVLRPTHSYPGILPNAYLDTSTEVWESTGDRMSQRLGLPADELVVLHRQLIGGGIHDAPEMIDYSAAIRDLPVHFVMNEEAAAADCDSAWHLPERAALFDGVLTGSTTLAAEAVVQGVPTLLISKAERGFLDHLAEQPQFFRWREAEMSDCRFTAICDGWMQAMRCCRNGGRQPVTAATRPTLVALWGEPVAQQVAVVAGDIDRAVEHR